jgi:hypothetical protein
MSTSRAVADFGEEVEAERQRILDAVGGLSTRPTLRQALVDLSLNDLRCLITPERLKIAVDEAEARGRASVMGRA